MTDKEDKREAPTPVPIENPKPLEPVEPSTGKVKKGKKPEETYVDAIFRLENSGLTIRQSVVQADLLVVAGEVIAKPVEKKTDK